MGEPYHYRGCALPNVFLDNGFRKQSTPYGEGVTIHDVDGLHDALGRALVTRSRHLTGYKVRFFREELTLSLAVLAAHRLQTAVGSAMGKERGQQSRRYG